MTGADGSRVRTVFIGTGSFAVPSLRALAAAADVDVVGVVTAPAPPAGRRGALRASPVAEAASEFGRRPILSPERLRRPDALAEVLALGPELIVLADYGQIVPPALLDVRLGALNLHPSLLPRHRGASPIPATIRAGDRRTGVSLMRMDQGLDTGPIVATETLALRGDETAPDLESELADRAARLLLRSLGGWIRGELEARPQASDGATLTRPLRRDDGRLDPERFAVELERQVRAFQPWPGSWFDVPSGRFTIWQATVGPDLDGADAGALGVVDGDPALQTAEASLRLLELQPAGGRRMSGAEAVRGRPGLLLDRVESPSGGLQPGPIERPVGYFPVP